MIRFGFPEITFPIFTFPTFSRRLLRSCRFDPTIRPANYGSFFIGKGKTLSRLEETQLNGQTEFSPGIEQLALKAVWDRFRHTQNNIHVTDWEFVENELRESFERLRVVDRPVQYVQVRFDDGTLERLADRYSAPATQIETSVMEKVHRAFSFDGDDGLPLLKISSDPILTEHVGAIALITDRPFRELFDEYDSVQLGHLFGYSFPNSPIGAQEELAELRRDYGMPDDHIYAVLDRRLREVQSGIFKWATDPSLGETSWPGIEYYLDPLGGEFGNARLDELCIVYANARVPKDQQSTQREDMESSAQKLADTVVHELGHAFGLGHAWPGAETAVMSSTLRHDHSSSWNASEREYLREIFGHGK